MACIEMLRGICLVSSHMCEVQMHVTYIIEVLYNVDMI